MRIQLFGEVQAVDDTGGVVDLGPPKCRAVLAALALSAGQAVPVSRLVDLIWGPAAPRTADKTLQSYVTRLRKGLGPTSIARVGAAYRLEVPADAVDVIRFQRLLAAGDVSKALDAWSAVPLAGLELGGLTATVDGLVEQWLGALESDLERQVHAIDGIGGGSPASPIVATLTELTARHPFREGLWALLMTALYRQGRQADALAAYRRARHHLVDGLGVEPGVRLRDLEAAILDHDERLDVDRPTGSNRQLRPTGTVTFGFCEPGDGSTPIEAAAASNATGAPEAISASNATAAPNSGPAFDRLVRATAEACGGSVFSAAAETFGVAFNRAADAISWALQLQDGTSEQTGHTGEGSVRVALHTGETEEHGGGYYGTAVNVASRLVTAGHGGQILVTALTAALVPGRPFRNLGTVRLEGVVADQTVLQLGDRIHPPLRTGDGNRGNLPRRQGRLIGREQSVADVVAAVDRSPVVTLVGPGGIGKTRLAIAAGRVVADADRSREAWLVELAGVASSDGVPRAVADTLNIVEKPGRTLTETVVETLRSRRAVLVLDNCEHVIDGAAELARSLAEHCLEIKMVTTSREGLGLVDEQLVVVAPLDPAGPGVELFNERARAVSPTFDPEAVRAEVEEICRRLDGVPLAIELAAARASTLSPSDLVARLDDRLRLLSGGRRSGLERHRTLRATIRWSYDLLNPEEQTLFQRLSIFIGPFDLEAAESVAGGRCDEPTADRRMALGQPPALLDVDWLLGGLVEQSMVTVESGPFGRRFRLLETMRQFGAEHLQDAGETDMVAAHHARWCEAKVVAVGQLLAGPAESEGVARLEELWPNLRAAFDWACATGRVDLARCLMEPIAAEIYVRNQTELGEWAERLLAVSSSADQDLIAFGVIWAGRRYMVNQDPAGYRRIVERYGMPEHPLIRYGQALFDSDFELRASSATEAVELLRQQGDHHLARLVELVALGLTLLSMGRLEEHDELVGGLVGRFRAEGPPSCLNWGLIFLGTSAALQGERDRRDRFLSEAAEVDLPDRTRAWNKPMEARSLFRRGDRSRALQVLREHVDELLAAGDMHGGRMVHGEFVNMMVGLERLSEARYILDFIKTTDLLDSALARETLKVSMDRLARFDRQVSRSAVDGSAVDDGVVDGGAVGRVADIGPGRDFDDQQALRYMSETLARLGREA